MLLELRGAIEEEREALGIVGVGHQLAARFAVRKLGLQSVGNPGAQLLRDGAVTEQVASLGLRHPRAGVFGDG